MAAKVWAALARIVSTGLGVWLVDRVRDLRESSRRRSALRLVFDETSVSPYYIEQTVFPSANAPLARRQLLCVGVLNSADEAVPARVVVEEVGAHEPPFRPERALQVFGVRGGESQAIVQPHSSAIAFFEFVEKYEGHDMAYLCFAEGVNECYVGRNTTVKLRVEGVGSVNITTFVVKTHGWHGVHAPFEVSVFG